MHTIKRLLYSLIFTTVLYGFLSSQTTNAEKSPLLVKEKTGKPLKDAITGWGQIKLGSNLTNVFETIQNEYPWLSIEKDPFNDIISERNNRLMTMTPNRFFRSFSMQFFNSKLYLIRIVYTKEHYNFNTLYNLLKTNYGSPDKITFPSVHWKTNGRELILERPDTVKYILLNQTNRLEIENPEPHPVRKNIDHYLNLISSNM